MKLINTCSGFAMRPVWRRAVCLGMALVLTGPVSASDEARTWTSTSGTTVEAKFLGHDQGRVRLRKSDGSVIEVPMSSLTAADQSWVLMNQARAAQRGKTESRVAPLPIPAGKVEDVLPTFRRGDEAGYNAFFESRNYDAGLDANGHLHVFLKENRSRVGQPLRVYLDCFTRGKDVPYQGISVLGFYEIPDPEKQPDVLTLHGVFERNVPFVLTLRFSEQGLRFEVSNVDPPGLKTHTTLRLRVRFPGVPGAKEAKTAAERRALLTGWQVVSTPRKGKALTYTYSELHESMGGLNERIAIDAPVFGTRRITFVAPDPDVSWLVPNPLPGYNGMELWRGFTVACTKNYTEDTPGPLLFEIDIK